MDHIGHLIQGETVYDGRLLDIKDPATGETIRKVHLASRETTLKAINAAKAAFPAWAGLPCAKRARFFFAYRELLVKNKEEIVALIGSEHGKISHDAQGEVQRAIENVEYAASAPEILKGEYSKNVGPDIDSWSEFLPLGVVAGITPFNFPAMVPLWMYPLAIAAGNTFVLKPSERAPSSAFLMAKLLHEAGLPAGVLNVVNGDRESVEALLEAEDVKAVSFVGSTPVAQAIYKKASAAGKRCQALGGAKNHAVVLPDAPTEYVANALMGAAFGSSGERCMAISAIVAVGDDTADRLVACLSSKIAGLKIGSYKDASNDFGPLISQEAKERIEGFIQRAKEQGANLVVDGRGLKVKGYEGGFFTGATLIDKVHKDMECYQKEIFGPVLVVLRVKNLSEALQLIKDHEYGNGTCLFTRDGEAARLFKDQVQAGMVGINVPLPVPVSYHSFGGWKRSLFGDLAAYGPDGARFYTQRKTITQRWPKGEQVGGMQFSFPT